VHFVKRVYEASQRDDIFNGAAALGFYLTLAIFPAMIFLMALIPYLPVARVDQAMMDLLGQALPQKAAAVFEGVVHQVVSERRTGLLSLGLIAALWSASTGMHAVMQQLNTAHGVEERRGFLQARVTALALTLLCGALILGAFTMVVLGGAIQGWLGHRFGFGETLLTFFVWFRWAVIVVSLLLGISLIYHYGPHRKAHYRFITAGSVTATLLLIAASVGFSVYTSNFNNYSAVYGSLGAVIMLMLSLYIAGLVILVGAEIDAEIERGNAAPRA
jgi:membrane protein